MLALGAVAVEAQVEPPPPDPPTPDVEGTWELVAAEAVPFEDALVFARLTFDAGRFDAVYVFLDPDDAELIGSFESGRYQPSAGQILVRQRGDVTVFDVAREPTLLTVRDVETGVILLLRQADPALALDPDLVGAWTGTRAGRAFGVTFGPDGRASIRRGDDVDDGEYVVAGPYVLLGDDPARYTFARDGAGRRQLVVEADGERTVLTRTSD